MELRRPYIPDSAFFKLAFVFSICMLFFIAAVYFTQLSKVNESQELLIKSRERQVELAKLLSIVKDVESMQRGYIITGDTAYRTNYVAGKSKVAASINALKSLSNNNKQRINDLDGLHQAISERLKIIDRSVGLHFQSGSATALNESLKNGISAMAEIDALASQIHQNENAALRRYEHLHASHKNYLPYITGCLVLFSVIIFIISFYKMTKDGMRIRKMNHDLLIVNQSFQHAEEISGMGHWKRSLANTTIEPSDNMYRLLGLEPGALPYDEQMLMQFVHPEDSKLLAGAFAKVKDGQTPDITYRIIRADGKLRYFKSAAKLITLDGIPMMLGATCDVTRQVENRLHIEQKNKELEIMVEELASFSHVASHDLQEPLRRMQVFISRITDEEQSSLSANAKEYFERIKASALRTEMLIDDLLLYAETRKKDQVFETSDLNVLLEEAKQELQCQIITTQAQITAAQLPVLPVIPFQIRQMFINLLGNAIKYSKPDISPVISVTCSKIKGRDIAGVIGNKTYYEISIADNGIGFLPEYAERIFVLFHRLHPKSKYSGTGIGLTICKKIAENHNGFITAQGEPGIGATFKIYLPK